MSEELWQDLKTALKSSNVAQPLRKYLQAEYTKRTEQLVADPNLITAGKAQELRKLLKDLFPEGVDSPG